jgi:uncharacterized RDD family membrane protein YckC
MKCPKCGYLGFEEVDRCRNCGYEFSLAAQQTAELSLKAPEIQIAPIEDLGFLRPTDRRTPTESTPADLPLFGEPTSDDEPLIKRPSAPRQPLAVRRATPELPRLRSEPRAQTFELAFDADPEAASSPVRDAVHAAPLSRRIAADARLPDPAQQEPARQTAGLFARLIAVVIDLLILLIVDVAAVYLTMKLCGITFFELGILPKAPLLGFLVLENGGYLVGFTAGGQTLGKMVMGIRVVSSDEHQPLGVGRALERTLLWAILAAPAGLGFVTAFFSPDRRGLHDRLAGTRVVRASA